MKIIQTLRNNWPLIVVLTIVLALRLPSFWEPYWYGDEGIYLALGQAMQRGAVLYRDIWDNKPPLLYVLYALHPTLLWAKISATIFVIGTCFFVYLLAKKLANQNRLATTYALIATTVVGIYLSIPLLEGTIANAELYFTLPIVAGALLIISLGEGKIRHLKLHLLGLLAASAFLFKVPAFFDFIGIFIFLAIVLWAEKTDNFKEKIASYLKTFLPIGFTFLLPIIVTLVYFYWQHALNDYMVAAFSQNAAYVSVDTGPLSKLSNPLFVKAILLLLALIVLIVLFFREAKKEDSNAKQLEDSFAKKWISKELLLLALWFGFSLYGALLSGRPYMHYLLQIVPPAVLLFGYLLINLKKYWYGTVAFVAAIFFVSQQFIGGFALPVVPYYQNWAFYILGEKSWQDYVNFFDSRTLNSYAISSYVIRNTNPDDKIFVWGDAAFVYVLSNRPPATKFIQAHHLTTIDPKNYDLVIQKLEEVKPKFILVSRPGHFAFPKLEELIKRNYRFETTLQDMYVYGIISP